MRNKTIISLCAVLGVVAITTAVALSQPSLNESILEPSPTPFDKVAELNEPNQKHLTSAGNDHFEDMSELLTATPVPALPRSEISASPDNNEITDSVELDFEFADLADLTFYFSSGVGAWCTELKILPDGTFYGYYSDQDMGDIDSDYPNGTRYSCSFSGRFTELKKISDYEYSMKCEALTQEGVAGEELIGEDGIRYITSTPYGFDNAEEIMLYLPGMKLNKLPEMFLTWVNIHPEFIDSKGDAVLDFYGIYNVSGEQGFGS